jgi:hypothetical protein
MFDPASRSTATASGLGTGRNGRCRYMNSTKLINVAFPIHYFDQLGIPRLAA